MPSLYEMVSALQHLYRLFCTNSALNEIKIFKGRLGWDWVGVAVDLQYNNGEEKGCLDSEGVRRVCIYH